MSEHPEGGDGFVDHLFAEDELGLVVRAHIYIEASLNDFIAVRVVKPEELPRLHYESRLRLAVALGLNKELFQSLKLLGDIRNSFSHNVSATLSDARVKELYLAMPAWLRKFLLDGYNETRAKVHGKVDIAFDDLPHVERFRIIALMLKEGLTGAANHARRRKEERKSKKAEKNGAV
jgi:hypothetical protein